MYLGYYTICMHTIFLEKDAFFSRRFQLWLWTSCVEWLIYARSDCGLKSDLFIRAPELSAGRPDRAADIINTFSSFSTHSCFSFLCHYVKRKLWKAQKSCLFLSILDTQVFMCNSNKNIIHSDILLHQKGHFSIDSNVNLNINVYLFTQMWKQMKNTDDSWSRSYMQTFVQSNALLNKNVPPPLL